MHDQNVRDVVLLSRARLARNLADFPFPGAMHGDDGAKAQLQIAEALAHAPQGNDYALLRVHDMPDIRRRALVEQNVISRELLSGGEFAAVLLRRDENVSLMINEDDHLRIHALLPGWQMEAAAALAMEVDDAIGQEVRYAFDAELGFLTTCPTNTGTGMRMSAMLHLPSLTRLNEIAQLVQELVKLGITLRPVYTEEGEAYGDLYLVANQVALGRSEQELVESIDAVIGELVERERRARERLLLKDDIKLEDRLMRSLGILRYARRISQNEWMRRWSDVRLAIQAGMFHYELESLDALMLSVRPAHLELAAGRELSPQERETARASLVREALQKT